MQGPEPQRRDSGTDGDHSQIFFRFFTVNCKYIFEFRKLFLVYIARLFLKIEIVVERKHSTEVRDRYDQDISDVTGGIMTQTHHAKAAEHHENAAKSHRQAAEHHGKDDKASHEHSTKAHEHSTKAHEHSQEAHKSSEQKTSSSAKK